MHAYRNVPRASCRGHQLCPAGDFHAGGFHARMQRARMLGHADTVAQAPAQKHCSVTVCINTHTGKPAVQCAVSLPSQRGPGKERCMVAVLPHQEITW